MPDQLPASLIPSLEPAARAGRRSGPSSTLETWLMAVAQPSDFTYQAIANSPAASLAKAIWWMFLASLIATLALRLFNAVPQSAVELIGALLAALFQACMVSVSSIALVWLLNLIARPFGGRASFVQAAYTLAALSAPLTICTPFPAVLRVMPYPGAGVAVLLELLLACYQLVLVVIAVKAIHRLTWVGALIAALGAPVAFILCLGSILYVLYRL